MEQHTKFIRDEKWDLTGVFQPRETCNEGFDWKNEKTISVKDKWFQRKVREKHWKFNFGSRLHIVNMVLIKTLDSM